MDINLNFIKLPHPKNIKISYPKQIGNAIITWDEVINPNLSEIIKIGYNIYRGISINGIFYKLNKEFNEYNYFEDRNVNKNPNTQYWYKVSTVYQHSNGNSVEGIISGPVTYQVLNTNRWFTKINERNLWILKNDAELYDLYTYKTEGIRCKSCYDPIRGASVTKSCSVCLGAGIEGGYEPTFQLYIRRKPAQQELSLSNTGFSLDNSPGAWTISTVILKNKDLVISPQGTFYTIKNSNVNHAAGYLFHQELQLKELDPNDPLYNLKRVSLYPNI